MSFIREKNKGDFEEFDNRIDTLFGKAIRNSIFPGAAVGISVGLGRENRQRIINFGNGRVSPSIQKIRKNTLFDLASLTKPLGTTLAVLLMISEKRIQFETSLAEIFEKIPSSKQKITVRQLLNHCSGLPAHRKYYQHLLELPEEQRKNQLVSLVMEDEGEAVPGEKAIYSDLGFMILGWIVEKVSGEELDSFIETRIMEPVGLKEKLLFTPEDKDKQRCAATEDCPWRKYIVQGTVHDQNSFAVGGVSGQAGLFGDITSVLHQTTRILAAWKNSVPYGGLQYEDVREALRRQNIVQESTWALGFDTPDAKGSSAGKYLSRDSVGHLGYTGTSFWIDPDRDLVIVLLTNRIHPSSENNSIREFRPLFHDTVVEALGLV